MAKTGLWEEKQMIKVPCFGYEGYYEVTDCGKVISLKRTTTNGKTLAQGSNGAGYKTVTLSKNGNSQTHLVHRLVVMSLVGQPPAGKTDVNHKDGNKHNNHIENLEWVSRQENIQHSVDNGLQPKNKVGHEDCQSKFFWAIFPDGCCGIFKGLADFSRKYGISRRAIIRVINGEQKSYKGFIFGGMDV